MAGSITLSASNQCPKQDVEAVSHEAVQNLGVLCRSPKRTPGRTLGDGMVPVERPVHYGGAHLQHQTSTSRRPAHLLLSIHSAVQQPLNRALGDRRRNRFIRRPVGHLALLLRDVVALPCPERHLRRAVWSIVAPPTKAW
jgi:hypothetical protein